MAKTHAEVRKEALQNAYTNLNEQLLKRQARTLKGIGEVSVADRVRSMEKASGLQYALDLIQREQFAL